jgi:hypothetical protein
MFDFGVGFCFFRFFGDLQPKSTISCLIKSSDDFEFDFVINLGDVKQGVLAIRNTELFDAGKNDVSRRNNFIKRVY